MWWDCLSPAVVGGAAPARPRRPAARGDRGRSGGPLHRLHPHLSVRPRQKVPRPGDRAALRHQDNGVQLEPGWQEFRNFFY